MTLEQLRYFVAVCELHHIGKAARQENISQPSLSIAIKKLEKELGVPLLRGNGRGIEVTEYGNRFAVYAKSILQQVEEAKHQMKDASEEWNTEIRIAYTSSVANYFIPQLFKAFLEKEGKRYLIYSNETPSDSIAQGLKNGTYDLGVCSVVVPDFEIEQIPIFYQPLVVIVPENHPWKNKMPKDLEEFSLEPFISYREDYPMYRQINRIFEKEGKKPRISHFAYSEDAIARLVEQELGVAIVAWTESLADYRIQILQPDWIKEGRTLFLTSHKNRYQGQAVKKMKEFILKRTCD